MLDARTLPRPVAQVERKAAIRFTMSTGMPVEQRADWKARLKRASTSSLSPETINAAKAIANAQNHSETTDDEAEFLHRVVVFVQRHWRSRRAHTSLELGGTKAAVLQRAWRLRVKRRGDGVYVGYLMKTASGNGPLERLRAARLRAVGACGGAGVMVEGVNAGSVDTGGDQVSLDLRSLQPTAPSFPRWFVLDERSSTLSIYTTAADHRAGLPPKGRVENLAAYAVIPVRTADGLLTLALLPRRASRSRASSPFASPRPGSSSPFASPRPGSSSPFASPRHADCSNPGGNANQGKSWYLCSSSDEVTTQEWCRRLRRAGAASKLSTEPPKVASAMTAVSSAVVERISSRLRSPRSATAIHPTHGSNSQAGGDLSVDTTHGALPSYRV